MYVILISRDGVNLYFYQWVCEHEVTLSDDVKPSFYEQFWLMCENFLEDW
ncbi:hypothetical protein [Bacteroides sp.]|nr:hypothetical protein [Bacteroides sp.]MDD3036424.1 hypothetical protein [Bacteroides sp.]